MDDTSKPVLPTRKHPRLNSFDYSSSGAYFITICTQDRRCILSRIVVRGLAPAVSDVTVEYTKYGQIAAQQLELLQNRYPSVEIDSYVIMPNHIHAVLMLHSESSDTSSHPTVPGIVCAYKSLTTSEFRKTGGTGKLFQTSFYEHIIRGREDYDQILHYIHDNPTHWYYDELYTAY